MITGAELTLDTADGRPAGGRSVALLAIDRGGYGNLCRLLTAAHEGHEKGTAGIAIERVAEAAGGLVAIVPLGGALCDDLARGAREAGALLGTVRDAFGDRAFTATWRHKDGGDDARTHAAIEAELLHGVSVVATARPLYTRPEKKGLADILHCIRHKTTLDAAGTSLPPNAEAFMRPARRMLRLFGDRPEWVSRTAEVAERCAFSLGELEYRFPSESLCLPGETPDDALRRLVEEGCARRYPGGVRASVREQMLPCTACGR